MKIREIIQETVDYDEEIYQEHGFEDRDEYLQHLADEANLDVRTVEELADSLGEEEDFGALPIEVNKYVGLYVGKLSNYRR